MFWKRRRNPIGLEYFEICHRREKIQKFQIEKVRSRESSPASVFKIFQTLQDLTLQDLKDFENRGRAILLRPKILNDFKFLRNIWKFQKAAGFERFPLLSPLRGFGKSPKFSLTACGPEIPLKAQRGPRNSPDFP